MGCYGGPIWIKCHKVPNIGSNIDHYIMALLTLPSELLFQIMGYLRDSQDVTALRSLMRTCQVLHEQAEVYLYSTAKFTTLSALYQFLDATSAKPQRIHYLRHLQLLYSTSRYDHGNVPTPPDLTSFSSLTSFVSESPECQPWSVKGTHWNLFMNAYIQAFKQASLLNESLEFPRPLQNLRSLILHWTGPSDRFWNITAACPIFLIPQLHSLHISCVGIGQEDLTESEAKKLKSFCRQTQLKSLMLSECVVSVEALGAILSFPRALQSFSLCEKFYHRHDYFNDRFAVEDTDTFNQAIAQQSESLEHLQLFRHSQFSDTGKTLALSLSNFPVLEHLQLGPFLSLRINAQRSFRYILEPPVPPSLKSLWLDEFGLSLFKNACADNILTDMLVADFLANAEAHGLPFTLNVSIQSLSRMMRRIDLDSQDGGLVSHKLIKGLEKQFQQRQDASVRSQPGADSGQFSENRASSRLQIFTNIPGHLIPPFLHNEVPQPLLVRYDSSHPDRFLSTPYVAIPSLEGQQ
ncbi:hypothetical protein F4804DRAFT_265013 [Jackrogersella minutella]|nr:hypothetical protein F4804DRAFT_265013 [Jackrogersella minutella]